VVFWQTMSLAEFAVAVWALECYGYFSATCFTFHAGKAPFSLPKTNERLYVSLETTRAAAKLGDTVKHAFSVQEINPVGLLLLAQSDTYTSNECACAREIKEQAEQLSKGLAGAGNSAGFRD
jgi:hypothetical protein